jgi:predicted DNA-binding transcriptional regulator AlpA
LVIQQIGTLWAERGVPTLATILEEVRQLREDLKSRNRSLLTVPEAAAFLGIPEKSVRNRLGQKATDPFPVTPVRLGGRVLFCRYDLEQFVETLSQK